MLGSTRMHGRAFHMKCFVKYAEMNETGVVDVHGVVEGRSAKKVLRDMLEECGGEGGLPRSALVGDRFTASCGQVDADSYGNEGEFKVLGFDADDMIERIRAIANGEDKLAILNAFKDFVQQDVARRYIEAGRNV